MKNLKVVKVESESIMFDNGAVLYSDHESDCCEHHWLSFGDIELDDFDDLRFDLSDDKFFKRIEGYGIELIPIKGWPVRVPGYGSNNGYYSDHLDLRLEGEGIGRVYDITECQDWSEC